MQTPLGNRSTRCQAPSCPSGAQKDENTGETDGWCLKHGLRWRRHQQLFQSLKAYFKLGGKDDPRAKADLEDFEKIETELGLETEIPGLHTPYPTSETVETESEVKTSKTSSKK